MTVSAYVRAGVLRRADECCERCGRHILRIGYSLQHRRAGKMGGSLDPFHDTAVNLGVLCGSATTPGGCHLWAESERQAAAAAGWVVAASVDVSKVPVLVRSPAWSRPRLVILTEHFTYREVAPLRQDVLHAADGPG